MCHQGPKNALLVKYPVKIKNVPMKTHLNTVRKIEDQLLANGLNMDSCVSILHDMSGLHGNDSRDAVSRIRLCYSENFGDSPWLMCHALSNDKCIIEKTPMIAHKDMRQLPHADPACMTESLGPAERAAQIGCKGWKHILRRVLCGQCGEEPATSRKIVLADLNPCFGDVMDASWLLQQAHLTTDADMPLVVACGFYLSVPEVEKSKFNGMSSYIRGMLLRSWWESCPEAGPAEPQATAETTVNKPLLKVLTYAASGKAIVPDVLKDRFSDAVEDVRVEWLRRCESASSTLQGLATLTSAKPTQNSTSVRVQLAGPELAEHEIPLDIKRDLGDFMDAISKEDLEMETVSLI